MKKKIFGSLSILLISFSLVGCGGEEEKQDENKLLNDMLEGLINEEININDNYNDNEINESDIDNIIDSTIDNIELYSDSEKLIYNFNNLYHLIYYYEGNKITGLQYRYDYGSAELAALSKSILETDNDPSIKSVVQDGRYIIVTYNEEEYKDMTVEEVKETYSYLEQIYE